ncbi:type IV inositol polyphosphate 5-phosphatase 3-like isoform X1 [Chenopodium quinoa]|uniref:type IV inositol polyphosphate 5-phosphatase 3-like isoform X1 n=1 Tax=Chenopodium quinoa TaxID=63459 RepID=UPI000B76E52C|nr:type IV inositol polyphosphate 5-phosphatase 3-like isoform X1 [Chenopodium quinoa]XP_021737630.1 type IV inositol polyphosphate 5-phosphatase 3-like isoform X1 [Chenopodium quinoa]XP_021737631.1 type IV inositol polyphosphate 5-phosphatase 3-like isoform X1 [Chenopodium quinoa]
MQPRHTRRRSLERNGERSTSSSSGNGKMSWAELCCLGCTCLQLLWPRVVLRKWLNISSKDSDYSADTDVEDIDDDDDDNDDLFGSLASVDEEDNLPRLRRRNSETFRAQYIHTKDIRVCVGTWNVGGKFPPDDLDIEDWININEPSDIYVLGLQEIVPLNAGNIFGAEDNRPALQWESIIRDTLSRVTAKKGFKSYSDPPSPSKFKPSEDIPDIEDEISLGSDSEGEEEVYPVDEELNGFYEVRDKLVSGDGMYNDPGVSRGDEIPYSDVCVEKDLKRQTVPSKRFKRLQSFQSGPLNAGDVFAINPMTSKLTKTLSGTERIGLSWPEPPLDLLAQRVLERPLSFKSGKSCKVSKSFRAYNSFKINGDYKMLPDASTVAALDLETLIRRKRRPEYVRIASKQMVGIFLTIWVRKDLRKHIQNLKVSTVGVGVMGYIGNKGAVSISMSIYQTLFCFICTHLTSGEKEADQLKRNADVNEIHRRTYFRTGSGLGVPKSIYDHERIIWLGDLNYRISISYDDTRKLISEKEWSKLVECDQLVKEFRKGHVFDGWSEGILKFPPTYKYEMNSDNYYGEDLKVGRRNPAWCDRVLSFGKGIKQLDYRRCELIFSDHRPVTAIYDIEVEVFSPRKLQLALTFTNAEVENEDIVFDHRMNAALSHLRPKEQDMPGLAR